MKIGLAQINTTVGDISGNAAKIIDFHRRAEEAGCDLVIYPELAISGYPPRDLVEKRSFVQDNLKALKEVSSHCWRSDAIVGFVDHNPSSLGKPFFNAAALISRGSIDAVYHKSLLPTYDVFDEGRYFEPGESSLTFVRSGLRFGVTICEDIWGNQATSNRQLYRENPLDRLKETSLDYIINISASPFSIHKEEIRQRITTSLSGQFACGIIYINLVGGNDDLIFDGASFIMDKEGRIKSQAASFAEDLVFLDTGKETGGLPEERGDEMSRLTSALILGLRDYVVKCGFDKVIIGLSGGIDSAVSATLAARALGPENVIGSMMPSPYTSRESIEDASRLADNLGIKCITIPIDNIYSQYLDSLEETFRGTEKGVAEENIQARIRGNLLMAMSNKFGYLVVNTGNKSELAMGYCTLYGDLLGGLSVLGDVPKTMVYPLGRCLNGEGEVIPERIFTKPPSAELKPGQTDQDSLPPYEVLDPILKLYIEDNLDVEEIASAGFNRSLVAAIINRVDRNEYKRRQAPPALRVTFKAFGIGRRLPIAQKYRHSNGQAPSV